MSAPPDSNSRKHSRRLFLAAMCRPVPLPLCCCLSELLKSNFDSAISGTSLQMSLMNFKSPIALASSKRVRRSISEWSASIVQPDGRTGNNAKQARGRSKSPFAHFGAELWPLVKNSSTSTCACAKITSAHLRCSCSSGRCYRVEVVPGWK